MTPRNALWAVLAALIAFVAADAEAQCRIVNGRMVCTTSSKPVVQRSGVLGFRRTVRYVTPATRYTTRYSSPVYSSTAPRYSGGSYAASGASHGGSSSYVVTTPVETTPTPKPATDTDVPVVSSGVSSASCCDDCDDLREAVEELKDRVSQLEIQSGFSSGVGSQAAPDADGLPPADRLLALCRPPVIPTPRVLLASR